MMNPNFSDESRYLDLSKFISDQTVCYTDFEGMAGVEGILERVDKEMQGYMKDDPKVCAALRTLMVHYAYTVRDQVGEDPPDEVFCEVMAVIFNLITCRYWLKEDAK